jgi:hypothetical protein
MACIIDRVVMLERQRGHRRGKFEREFGPSIHKLIFRRWALGVVPGSNFLANLLMAWERLGYFKGHLDKPKKALWLLVAYATVEGVPDPEGKDTQTGWYRLVKRDPENARGTEPIQPRGQLPSVVDRAAEEILPPRRPLTPIPVASPSPERPSSPEVPAEAVASGQGAANEILQDLDRSTAQFLPMLDETPTASAAETAADFGGSLLQELAAANSIVDQPVLFQDETKSVRDEKQNDGNPCPVPLEQGNGGGDELASRSKSELNHSTPKETSQDLKSQLGADALLESLAVSDGAESSVDPLPGAGLHGQPERHQGQARDVSGHGTVDAKQAQSFV